MAPKSVEKKKRRDKRKVRTEVSASSSGNSSSDEAPESPPPKKQKNKNVKDAVADPLPSSDDNAVVNEGDNAVIIPEQRKLRQDPEKAFEEFYLRQATKEFANDLDKLRSAGDFNDRSVSMLIRSLQQGTQCFSREERLRIGELVAK